MNIVVRTIETIERIDRLIRLRATGTPESMASRLGISKTKLYRIINIMKRFNAPVIYDLEKKSFIYENSVGFNFGFYPIKTERKNH